MLSIFCLILLIGFCGCDKSSGPGGPEYESLEEEIRAIVEPRVRVGAMVGVIDRSQQEHVFSFGTRSVEDGTPPDSNTVFDIGSITKTFTATLLADMMERGIITDDTVSHHLPAGLVTMPSGDSTEITFGHLVTHMSGLPRTPHQSGSPYPRPPGYDSQDPYAAYTSAHVYDYLTNYCVLEFEPGTYWGYSNTGMGLLGHILGLIDGTSYENVLKRTIFDVLGMEWSSLFLTREQLYNLADGHNRYLNIVPFYTANDIFQGCGMIKSTLSDLFKYLKANLGLTETPLGDAMEKAHQRTPGIYTGSMGYIGMAWYILTLDDGQEVTYHGGDTNGHSSYLGFNKSESTGVIVLLNCSMHDGTNLNVGPAIMKAILKY